MSGWMRGEEDEEERGDVATEGGDGGDGGGCNNTREREEGQQRIKTRGRAGAAAKITGSIRIPVGYRQVD